MRSPGASVLFVEDDPVILEVYAAKLEALGLVVRQAATAAAARKSFAESPPSVVCIDARLPDEPGTVLAVEFARAGARVILLTNDQEVFEHPPAGVAESLLKIATPPAELALSIERVLAAT